jgi:demethylspheroidene O-methyltransferase
LLVAEPIAGISGAESMAEAYFAFYLRAMGSGKARTFERMSELLKQAGFEQIQLRPGPMPLVASIITGVKAGKCVNLA